jgi:outer membrane protein TolC
VGEKASSTVILCFSFRERCAVAAVWLVLLFSLRVPAQTAAPHPTRLTLARALELAQANYPRIRAAAEQRAAAAAGVGVARTAYLPRTDVLWQTNRASANNLYGLLLPQSVIPSISGPVLPSDNGRSAWGSAGGALFSWQPFDFGLRRAQVDVARQAVSLAKATETLTRLDVALATANAYFDLAASQQFAAVAAANVERLRVFSNSVGVLAKQQLRPGADAAQADANFARARTQLIQAQTAVAVQRAVLASLIGLRPEEVDLDDSAFLQTLPDQRLPQTQATSHPAAKRDEALVNQQAARVTALNRTYVPQFNTIASLSGRGTGTALSGPFPGGTNGFSPSTMNWAVGVQATFPAFNIFSIHAQKKVEEANLRADKQRYQQTLDDVSLQVERARAEFDGARQAAQNTPTEVSAARLSESQQRARFDAGLASVVDVAVAESLLVQAEADDVVARLNVWRALAGLAAANGELNAFLAEFK